MVQSVPQQFSWQFFMLHALPTSLSLSLSFLSSFFSVYFVVARIVQIELNLIKNETTKPIPTTAFDPHRIRMKQNSNIGPAVPISPMSQLPESTANTCIDKESKLRALPGKHNRFLLSPPRSSDSQQVRDISSSSICISSSSSSSSSASTGTTANTNTVGLAAAATAAAAAAAPTTTSIARSGVNLDTDNSSSSINTGGIITGSGSGIGGGGGSSTFLKSPPPQYSSLHQTKRQMRTQNAFVSSSSNSVSNNCDSKNLNEITTTVTSQIGVPAIIESAEGKRHFPPFDSYTHTQNTIAKRTGSNQMSWF